MKKVLILLLVLTLTATSLMGCAVIRPEAPVEPAKQVEPAKPVVPAEQPKPPEPPKPPEMVEVNFGYMPNWPSIVTVITGINRGYFEEEGIKVNLYEFADGPTIIAAMEGGSISFGYIGGGAHRLPPQGRAMIIATSHMGSADEVIGNRGKGIEDGTDLRGKTVAMASGTSSEVILNLVLEEAGLTREDLNILDMDASAITTAMISGSIDAAATWSPNTLAIKEALGDDAVSLGDAMMFMDVAPAIASFVVNPRFAEKNQDLILRFTRALFKAKDFRAREENFRQIATWIAEQLAVDVETVYAQRADANWITSQELIAMIKDGSLEAYYQVQQDNFIAAGAFTERVPVSDYVLFQNMLDAAR